MSSAKLTPKKINQLWLGQRSGSRTEEQECQILRNLFTQNILIEINVSS